MLAMAIAVLWAQSNVIARWAYHPVSIFGRSIAFQFLPGKVRVFTPPGYPMAGTRNACQRLVRGIHNDQIGWEVSSEGGGKINYLLRPYILPHTPAADVYVNYLEKGNADIVRYLIDALDDPNRFVVAHVLLNLRIEDDFERAQRRFQKQSLHPFNDAELVQSDFDGLTVFYRSESQFFEDASLGHEIHSWTLYDPEQRAAVRDQWSQRLSVQIASVRYAYLLGIFLAFPFLAIIYSLLRSGVGRARRRRGVCHRCAYDLREAAVRCPECGALINDPPRPSHRKRARVAWQGVIIMVFGELLGFVLIKCIYARNTAPSGQIARTLFQDAHRDHVAIAATRRRLVTIRDALTEFERNHEGQAPAELADLVTNGRLTPEQISCPRIGFRYVYLRRHSTSLPKDTVVYEAPADAVQADREGISVLRRDGSIELWFGDDATWFISRLKGRHRGSN